MNNIHQELTLSLDKINDCYSNYRLIYPKADKAMTASIERYGQLSPVVVGPALKDCYPMIDGFKRLRASRKLGLPDLRVTVLQAGERALKAAMLHLNKKHHSMTAMEEAMIVRALYREHDLTQETIGTLLGYHKSWVSRRLALLDRLDDDVLEQVRLGLIGPGMIRELAKLPRGNQTAALDTIRKHTMTCREGAQLVALILESPHWAINNILYYPEPILSKREPDRPECSTKYQRLMKRLSSINGRCEDLLERIDNKPWRIHSTEEFSQVLELIGGIEATLKCIPKRLQVPDANF